MLVRLLRQERGSVIIMVAMAMVVMVGIAALAVDVGYLYMQKTKMQNGVDAAALAGATALTNTGEAENRADHYAQLNGLEPGKLLAAFSKNNQRLDLTYIDTFNTFFARVLGIDSVEIKVAAAAELAGPGQAFEYAIFSGSPLDILPINGSRLYVDGSVHSNDDLKVNGSRITITGVAEAVGVINVNGSNIVIGERRPGVSFVEMPDYTAQIKAQAAAANKVFNDNKTYYNGNHININGNIHINGTATLNGNTITGAGAILATGPNGDIYINGNIISASAGDQVCLYSENGDIHINGNGIRIDGIIYAPHGNIHINGNDITVNGRIIGNTVKLNGNNLTVNGKNVTVISLPRVGAKLVQ